MAIQAPKKTVSQLRSTPAPCLARAPAAKLGVGVDLNRGRVRVGSLLGPDPVLTRSRSRAYSVATPCLLDPGGEGGGQRVRIIRCAMASHVRQARDVGGGWRRESRISVLFWSMSQNAWASGATNPRNAAVHQTAAIDALIIGGSDHRLARFCVPPAVVAQRAGVFAGGLSLFVESAR